MRATEKIKYLLWLSYQSPTMTIQQAMELMNKEEQRRKIEIKALKNQYRYDYKER